MTANGEGYGVGERASDGGIPIPKLDVAPLPLKSPTPGIGLIGCGGISESHLSAYSRLGLRVLALCNRDVSKARQRGAEFYPDAKVFSDHRELLEVPGVELVDIATHPEGRVALISDSLRAGRHVLSQKPFVLDIDEGKALVELALEAGVSLAVNQNGRWAPHLAGIREAAKAGLIGEVEEVDVSIRWDHSWTVGTSFDQTAHLVLFDFGVHWFDFVATLTEGREIEEVSATTGYTSSQRSPQPMLASVSMSGPGLRVRLKFDGDSAHLQRDVSLVRGSAGALLSEGVDIQHQRLSLYTSAGSVEIPLLGDWFSVGFEGAMCELARAIQEGRVPTHAASNNIRSLELAFAACESANTGRVVRPGEARAFSGPPSSG